MLIKIIILSLISKVFALGPYVDGKFYPAKEDELKNFIKLNLEKSKEYKNKIKNKKIYAIISPHAGYVYSGRISAISYSLIDKKDTFIIIAPSHKALTSGAVTTLDFFSTPLGKVETDKDFIKELTEDPLFKIDNTLFENEHAIEVQLPFLQYRFKDFKIVPILINTQDLSKIKKIAQKLYDVISQTKKNTLTIVSSDFSHYPDYETANISDKTSIYSIKELDDYYFDLTQKIILSKQIKNLYTLACGSSAIILAINLSKMLGANSFIEIEQKNSYDENPTYSSKESVVGYVSGAFIKEENSKKSDLTTEEKKYILNISRNTIKQYLEGDKNIILPELDKNPKLNLPKAVFVTLTEKGYLRGCMGTTQPQLTLVDAVKYFSVISAFNDPRFSPLKKDEFDKIKIEISILSKPIKIDSYQQIKEKKDGVMIVSKNGSGLFLPQVWDYFKNKDEFLSELCEQKAGLKRDCYKDKNVEIYIFNVEKFEE